MGIKNYILFIILSIIVIISTIAVLEKLEEEKRIETGNMLTKVLQTEHQAINSIFDHKERGLRNLTKKKTVIDFAVRLSQEVRNQENLINHPLQSAAKEYFNDIIKKYGEIGFQIISPDSINLSSSIDDEIGKQNFVYNVNPEFLESIQSKGFEIIGPMYIDKPIDVIDNHESQKVIFIGSPIKNENNEVIATLVMSLDPKNIFSSTTKTGQVGFSGETYAFDHKGRFASSSRFKEQLVQFGLIGQNETEFLKIRIADPGGNLISGYKLTQKYEDLPLTYMAQHALSKEQGQNIEGYRDYRGVRVLGSWLWNEKLGIGLCSEIDEVEALSYYYYTRKTILVLLVIIIFTFLIGAIYLTKIKKREHETIEQLAQSDKMASLGLLSAGISHELNNPVHAINLGLIGLNVSINEFYEAIEKRETLLDLSQLRKQDLVEIDKGNDFEKLKKDISGTIKIMKLGVSQAVNILKALKNYSRIDRGDKVLIDIHECIDTAVALLDFKMKDKVLITRNYGNSLDKILCWPGELNQVFVNILSNAEHAINDKGEIEISTQSNGAGVKILIQDNGCGMSEQTLEKLFEPFFTTKEMGKGSGLGMSISKAIINKHNGKINVKSKVGEGTEFEIIFPK